MGILLSLKNESMASAILTPVIFFLLFSFGLPVCNARPIYIYIYIYIYNMDLKKSLIIENLYNSNREV